MEEFKKLSRAFEARKNHPVTLETGKSLLVLCIFYWFLWTSLRHMWCRLYIVLKVNAISYRFWQIARHDDDFPVSSTWGIEYRWQQVIWSMQYAGSFSQSKLDFGSHVYRNKFGLFSRILVCWFVYICSRPNSLHSSLYFGICQCKCYIFVSSSSKFISSEKR